MSSRSIVRIALSFVALIALIVCGRRPTARRRRSRAPHCSSSTRTMSPRSAPSSCRTPSGGESVTMSTATRRWIARPGRACRARSGARSIGCPHHGLARFIPSAANDRRGGSVHVHAARARGDASRHALRGRVRALVTLALVVATACAADAGRRAPGTVLFLTDFGVKDGAVAACKGVMLSIAPETRIVDLTHDVPPYDIEIAGEVLEQAVPFTDGHGRRRRRRPGRRQRAQGDRRPDEARAHARRARQRPLHARYADGGRRAGGRAAQPPIFPRRADVVHLSRPRNFAPVAAHLAAGTPLDSLGPPITPVMLDTRPARLSGGRIEGTVRYIEDPYGNVVTDLPAALLDSLGARLGDSLEVRVGPRMLRLPWRNTFSDVPSGQALAVIHSRGLLSFPSTRVISPRGSA